MTLEKNIFGKVLQWEYTQEIFKKVDLLLLKLTLWSKKCLFLYDCTSNYFCPKLLTNRKLSAKFFTHFTIKQR